MNSEIMNREVGEAKIAEAMNSADGALALFDVDNIGKINSAFGNEAGDKAIAILSDILVKETDAISCHLGGDKFMSFFANYTDEQAYAKVNNIIAQYYCLKEEEAITRAATLSAGVALITKGVSLEEADNRADKALYYIKQSGKGAVAFFQDTEFEGDEDVEESEIQTIIKGENGSSNHKGAMDVEYKYFAKLFEFMKNLSMRYDLKYSLLLIKISNTTGAPVSADENEKAMLNLERAISTTVRGVDINSRYSESQFFTILMESDEAIIKNIMERVFNCFKEFYTEGYFEPSYELVDIQSLQTK